MISSTDVEFFLALSRSMSLAAAARELGITPSAVTQRLKALERKLAVQLVDRSTRHLQLTTEGDLLASQGALIQASLEEVSDALSGRRDQVSGHLRVAAPFGFGRRYVAPVMASLRESHPSLTMTLSLFDDPVSMRSQAWDVLIHVGELYDSGLTRKRLAPNRRIVCAAPAYLERYGTPQSPAALSQHVCAVIQENGRDASRWELTHPRDGRVAVALSRTLESNDGEVAKYWGLEGACIILRSEWNVAEELREGKLVELLPEWRAPDADVVALMSNRTGRVARTVCFLQTMETALSPVPWHF